MLRRSWYPLLFLFLTGCVREVMDPLSLAPATSFSTWKPWEGNRLISSQYCQSSIMLPSDFECGELSLAELVDIALQNNPDTKITWATARSQAAQYGVAMAEFFPNITFNGQYFRQFFGSPVQDVPQSALNVPVAVGNDQKVVMDFFTQAGPDVNISYTLFDFGQRSAAALAAREALYFADWTHNRQIQTTVQTVMNDYYNYIYQLAVLKANEYNLLDAEGTLDSANDKFNLGLAALGDVAQARTSFLQSKITLTTQKNTVEEAYAQLAVDLGIPANLPFKVQGLPEKTHANPILADVDSLVCIAQEQRQDLLAAIANMKSQEATLLGAKRAVYPKISTTLSTGRYWFQEAQMEPKNHWSALFTLSFPLFNGFYYRNQIKSAEAELDLSKAKVLQTELTVIQSVTNAHMGIKTAAENLDYSEQYLKAAELQFKIANTNYKAGTMTILDVLSAQSALANARQQKANAQYQWYESLADLAYATGTLCATPEANEEICAQ